MAGRTILLTGATGKVGTTLLKNLVAEGHKVIAPTRNKLKAEENFDALGVELAHVKVVEADLFDENDIQSVVDACEEINAVIFNARSVEFLASNSEGDVSRNNFLKEFELACVIPYLIINEIKKKHNSLRDVIYISSMYGVVGPNKALYENFKKDSPINYGVAKAAQIHLTKELAVRLASDDVRVNAISYGGIEGRVNDAFKERYAKLTPMGKMLDESDLYPPVKYILDNKELKMTGQNLMVDGGWTIW